MIAERDLDYVTSAKLRGESTPFVMFREILPNVTGPIIVELTVRVGYAVFTVATLRFSVRAHSDRHLTGGRKSARTSPTSVPASGGRPLFLRSRLPVW